MAIEIERKFLVQGEAWRTGRTGTDYSQGYISTDPNHAVRVRVAPDQAWLNIKAVLEGIVRQEFEYEIPIDDAHALLRLCQGGIIAKTRYYVPHGSHTWEVDEFHGENAGLITAEVELNSADEPLTLPEWVGTEVSDDPRYTNARLSEHPFRAWTSDE